MATQAGSTGAKKKTAATVAAVAVAAALALGGTFAWQSISQTALNEASDVVNPGGRLHDDFCIDDKGDYNADIYVENFAEDEIFARVQLQEYMEIVVNQGVVGAEVVDTVVGTKLLDGTPAMDEATDKTSGYSYEYVTHYFDQANNTDVYWTWDMGDADSADVYYMPTFNMNKDSLVADRNGMYVDRIGGISNRSQDQYTDWSEWAEGDTKDATEIHDIDSNTVDEVDYDFENLSTYVDEGNVAIVEETHTAALVGNSNGLISMAEWLTMVNDSGAYDEAAHGNYWVYDTDGWVYWSSPISAGETTGLLLDSIELNQAMDDTWYYAINAEAQFVTAEDAGKEDNTGFYVDNDLDFMPDSAPSTEAEALLEAIGVGVSGESTGGDESLEDNAYLFVNLLENYGESEGEGADRWDNAMFLTPGKTYKVEIDIDAYYDEVEELLGTASVNVEVRAVEYNGNELALVEGKDYVFDFPEGTFEQDGVEAEDGSKRLTAEFTLAESVPYGTWIDFNAKTTSETVRGSGSASLIVTQERVDLDVELYDVATSVKVANSQVEVGSTYDVVGKLTHNDVEYTVFSTNESKHPLSGNVARYYDPYQLYVVHSYNFEQDALEINDDGQIKVLSNDPGFLGEFTPAITINELQILDENREPATHLYAYGQSNFYAKGELPLTQAWPTYVDWYYDYSIGATVYVVDVSQSREIPFVAYLYNELVEDAVYTIITSDVAPGTKFNGSTLTLAADETTNRIVIHVASEGSGAQGTIYVDINY